jgi:hypothetical protein
MMISIISLKNIFYTNAFDLILFNVYYPHFKYTRYYIMALKKEDKIRLDSLKKTFTMLVTNGIDEGQVLTMMGDQIDEFESITSSKLKVQFGEDPKIEIVDLSKDFVRTRLSNEDNHVLRAKVEGVPVDVKIFKRDDFIFTNIEIISALRILADEVESLDVELTTLGHADVRKIESKDDFSDKNEVLDDSKFEELDDADESESESEELDEYEFSDIDADEEELA